MRPNRIETIAKFTAGTTFVEAYGLLTASLLLGNGTEGRSRVVCLAGARPGDGTSTTAVNLALTLAGTGRRTLLVDTNFRDPMLHQLFDVPQSPGLAEVLLKEVPAREAVRSTKTQNLSLLTAGTFPGSPQVVLQSSLMRPLFDELKAGYDFVITDTAPALRFPDALHFAWAADGTIVVVPAGRAPRRAAMEVRRRLERVGATIIGVVLNRIDPSEVSVS